MHWPSFAYGIVTVYAVSFAAAGLMALPNLVRFCRKLWRRWQQDRRLYQAVVRYAKSKPRSGHGRVVSKLATDTDPIERDDWRVTGIVDAQGTHHLVELADLHPNDQAVFRNLTGES